MTRRTALVLRLTLTLAALFSAVWCASVLITGGFRFAIFTTEVRSTDPFRPLAFAVAFFCVRVLMFRHESVRNDVRVLTNPVTPSVFRWILVVVVFGLGASLGSAIAAGADQYGYMSQADLWLQGSLLTLQPAAANLTWPDAQWTLSPLGYRPSIHGDGIVPTYSPGLPLLLATFKFIGGQCAMGLVAPLAAALLVGITFSIGREAISETVGAAAAWLVATSPIVLYMMMSPMSDLPAAACWALAAYGCLRGTRIGAALAGLSAGAAILIRPNLVFVALVPAVWLLMHDARARDGFSRLQRAMMFALPVAVASVAIAALNLHLYGSATASGYGGIESLFTTRDIRRNIVNYTLWLVQSQTPLALVGLVALWVPGRGRSLLGGMSLAVAGSYILYESFDAWWYLRFLLPCWPALMLGSSRALSSQSGQSFSRFATIVLLLVGVYGVYYAHSQWAFDRGRGDQRYIKIAQLVAAATEPNSVVITVQHSGSLRYYGGRTTVRYDNLDAHWLDRMIIALKDRGVHPYILLDDTDHEAFTNRFASLNNFGRLNVAKVLEYRDATLTVLYDPLKPVMSADDTQIVRALPGRDHALACSAAVPFSMPDELSIQR